MPNSFFFFLKTGQMAEIMTIRKYVYGYLYNVIKCEDLTFVRLTCRQSMN